MPEHGKALAGIQDSQPYNQNYLRKTHKTPLVILEILQPLQVIPEISSSSSWHLFHGSRNGAAPTKLIQENFFQEQLVIVVRVVLWCSCTQTSWCPCQNCSKSFSVLSRLALKSHPAARCQIHIEKRPTFSSLWKMYLPEAVLQPRKHGLGIPGAPARTLWMRWT